MILKFLTSAQIAPAPFSVWKYSLFYSSLDSLRSAGSHKESTKIAAMIQLGAKDSNMRERRKGVSAGLLKEPAAFKRRVRRFSAAYLSYIELVIVYHFYIFCSSLHSNSYIVLKGFACFVSICHWPKPKRCQRWSTIITGRARNDLLTVPCSALPWTWLLLWISLMKNAWRYFVNSPWCLRIDRLI